MGQPENMPQSAYDIMVVACPKNFKPYEPWKITNFCLVFVKKNSCFRLRPGTTKLVLYSALRE